VVETKGMSKEFWSFGRTQPIEVQTPAPLVSKEALQQDEKMGSGKMGFSPTRAMSVGAVDAGTDKKVPTGPPMLAPAPVVGKPPSSAVAAEWARPLMAVGAETEKIENK